MDTVSMQKGASLNTQALKVVVKGPENLDEKEKGKAKAKEREVAKEKAEAKVAGEETERRKGQQWL